MDSHHWDRYVLPAVLACLGFFLIQTFNKSDQAVTTVPVLAQRLDNIEHNLNEVSQALSTLSDAFEKFSRESFSIMDSRDLEKRVYDVIQDSVAQTKRALDELEKRLTAVESDVARNGTFK